MSRRYTYKEAIAILDINPKAIFARNFSGTVNKQVLLLVNDNGDISAPLLDEGHTPDDCRDYYVSVDQVDKKSRWERYNEEEIEEKTEPTSYAVKRPVIPI